MHASARAHLKLCIETYLQQGRRYRIVDLGTDAAERQGLFADYSSSYEAVAAPTGAAGSHARYRLPLDTNSVDVLVTSQTFEHIPFFWATFLEIARVLRPGGLVFFCASSRGHPNAATDSWRFYPDAMRSLAAFGQLRLEEAHTDLPPRQQDSRRFDYGAIDERAYWGDTVGVFRKPERSSRLLPGVRAVLVWWANRIGGIDRVRRPPAKPGRAAITGRTRQDRVAPGAPAAGRDADLFGIAITEVDFDGATYFVPNYGAHRSVVQLVLSGNYAEPELHEYVAETMAEAPGSMIHAGTFFGDMLPSFARKCPGTVYAFEPVVENYLLARQTVEINKLSNVVLLHAGLSAGPGVATIETSDGVRHKGGGSRIVSDGSARMHQPQTVPLLSIDQFEIDDLTLIQLDVEGHELPVLEGAVRTIERCRPRIVIEDNARNCAPLLTRLGYTEIRRVDVRNRLYLAS